MDPITASLLTALGVAVKDKATGAVVRWLTEATKERARRLWGVIADTDEEKFAQRMVAEVMAEAAAFPPEKALVVHPLGTVGDVGIWGPGGELRLKLLWVNCADFPIHVRDMRVTTMLGGQQQWDAMLGDEFTLEPRGLDERAVALSPRLALPSFERGGASCDVSVSALVCGPWDEGRAQRTRELVTSAGIWVPTFGLEPVPTGLDDVADIDVKLETFLRTLAMGGRREVSYANTDRGLGLRTGATRDRLAAVASRLGYEVEGAGPNVAQVHRPNPSVPFLRRRNRMDGW